MNSEVLPVGTERLLNRLGYWLEGGHWVARDEQLDITFSAGTSSVVDCVKVMSVSQIKYRRTQAWFMHKGL